MNIPFLVESALLTHGLASVSDERLVQQWPFPKPCITWLTNGKIRIGNMESFIVFRQLAKNVIRVSRDNFKQSIKDRRDGALTASGTMLLADFLNIPFVVTSGMGGVSLVKDEPVCPDLPALKELNVVLIATSPKDVQDIEGTLEWCKTHKVPVFGRINDTLHGFMVSHTQLTLDGIWADANPRPPLLLLNPVEKDKLLKDKTVIAAAIEAGVKAKQAGRSFHPAANRYFDEYSGGRTSTMQFEKLIENAKWAGILATEMKPSRHKRLLKENRLAFDL